MRLVRNARLAGLLVFASLGVVLMAPAAHAATVSITDLTQPGEKIGAQVESAIFGLKLTGGGNWTGMTLDFANVGGDGEFDISDIEASPLGIAAYRDDGTTGDQFDAGDTKVSGAFTWTGLSADVSVSTAIPSGEASTFNFFVTITTSVTISDGDDFTVTIPGGTLCPGIGTSSLTLSCTGATTDAITADSVAPTAQMTSAPATVEGNVVWTFSEDVEGVSEDNVVLRVDGSNTNLGTEVTYNPTLRTATIDPDLTLSPGGSYRTIVNPAGASPVVADGAGNPVEAGTQATFSLGDVGSLPGIVRGNTWYLSSGPARAINHVFPFAKATDRPISGDWDGDGEWTAGVVRGNVWYITNENPPQTVISFAFGSSTDVPVVGNWDGTSTNRSFTPGVVRGNKWFVSNQVPPVTVQSFSFAKATDVPIVGDWDGNLKSDPGVVRGNTWFLGDKIAPTTLTTFSFAKATDYPITGDWDNDGEWTVGVVRGNLWYLANEKIPETLRTFGFGLRTDFPVVGDWDGDPVDAGSAGLVKKIVPGN